MQCPKCASELIENMRYCPYCGLDFDTKPRKVVVKSAPTQAQPSSGLGQKEYWDAPAVSPAKNTHNGQPGDELKKPGYTLFSAKGRLNRLKYFYFIVIINIAYLLLRLGLYAGSANPAAAWLSSFCYPLFFFLVALLIITDIKRFHDIGDSGYHVFKLLIPFYNIYIALKLLFKDSDISRSNTNGPYERNSWYWQVPLTLLLLPAVFYGLIAGGVAHAPAVQNVEPLHYYNQSQQISMTFPAGWKEMGMEGYLTTAQNDSGRYRITLQVKATTDPSFSEDTEDEFQQRVAQAGQIKFLSQTLGLKQTEVSGLGSTQRTINGVKFVVADFTHTADGKQFQHEVYLFGCQDGKQITIHMVLAIPYEREASDMFAAVDTLRLGSSATADPAKWD